MPDNLTVGNGLAGSGIDPFVGFGMTIGEAKDAGKIVQTRWIVEKDVLEHIYSESRAANVGRIDIGKNKAIGRLVRRKLGGFGVESKTRERYERLFEAAGRSTYVTIESIAAHLGHVSPQCLNGGCVSRAFIDKGRFQVRSEQGIIGIDQVLRVVKSRQIHMVVALNPEVRARSSRLPGPVWHEHLAIVAGIEKPC